jgi:hypothetical protein
MKNQRFWIVLGGIAVLSAAFLFLNFHAAVSNTQSEKNITTAGIGDGLPVVMQHRAPISIAMDGDGALVNALQQTLPAGINNAGLGAVALVPGLERQYPNPVLVVEVGKPAPFWTPFWATSQFSIQAGYASDGSTAFMGQTPATVNNSNGPVLTMHAEIKISDRSWGLISRPGYHQILADVLTQQIVAALKDLYQIS